MDIQLIQELVSRLQKADNDAAYDLYHYIKTVVCVGPEEEKCHQWVTKCLLALLRGKYDFSRSPTVESFHAWLRKVASNERKDAMRGPTLRTFSNGVDVPERHKDSPCDSHPTFEKLNTINEFLHTDLLAKSRDVNYCAIYHLQIRVSLYNMLLRNEDHDGRPYGLGFLVDHYLPWDTASRSLTIQPGWPPMEDTWSHLKPRRDEARHIGAADIVSALKSMCPAVNIQVNTWTQWCRRLRALVGKLVREFEQEGRPLQGEVPQQTYCLWCTIIGLSFLAEGTTDG
jgi:DNA-directed RNA polymerase specialized sigma24 family protein